MVPVQPGCVHLIEVSVRPVPASGLVAGSTQLAGQHHPAGRPVQGLPGQRVRVRHVRQVGDPGRGGLGPVRLQPVGQLARARRAPRRRRRWAMVIARPPGRGGAGRSPARPRCSGTGPSASTSGTAYRGAGSTVATHSAASSRSAASRASSSARGRAARRTRAAGVAAAGAADDQVALEGGGVDLQRPSRPPTSPPRPALSASSVSRRASRDCGPAAACCWRPRPARGRPGRGSVPAGPAAAGSGR